MRLFTKFVVPVLCLLASGAVLRAETKPSAPKEASSKKKDKNKDKEKKSAPKEPEKLSFPIPVGHDGKGLTLPSYGPDGKKKMNFTIGVANRVDEETVEMKKLAVETFDDEGEPDLNINLPVSTFNLSTKILTTRQEVTITREDFELTGKTMEFNTETRQGRLGGGVKMIIFNLDTGSKDDEAEEKPAEPKGKELPKINFPGTEPKPTIKKVNKSQPTNTQEPKTRE